MAPKVEDKKVEDKKEDKASPLKLGLLIVGWCVPRIIVLVLVLR